MVNVFAEWLGEGHRCCCGTWRHALQKVVSAGRRKRQRQFLACPAAIHHTWSLIFEISDQKTCVQKKRKDAEWKKKEAGKVIWPVLFEEASWKKKVENDWNMDEEGRRKSEKESRCWEGKGGDLPHAVCVQKWPVDVAQVVVCYHGNVGETGEGGERRKQQTPSISRANHQLNARLSVYNCGKILHSSTILQSIKDRRNFETSVTKHLFFLKNVWDCQELTVLFSPPEFITVSFRAAS